MAYYGVNSNDGSWTRLANKDAVIEWLMMGFNPDYETVTDSVKEAKEWIEMVQGGYASQS